MVDDIHGAPDGIDNRGDIFPLAFERIRVSIATVAPSTPIHGIHATVVLQQRQY
jgi:hypothetical protein